MHHHILFPQGFEQLRAQFGAEWLGSADMGNDPIAKEAALAAFGEIKDLVRHNDMPWGIIRPQGPHRADADDLADAQFFEGVDVCTIVHFGRRENMPNPVARQECQFLPLDFANHDR